MPGILLTGFMIGIILVVMGFRENQNLVRRNHLMGMGIVVIGIMIPVTPLSWYIYWEGVFGLFTLAIEHQVVIAFTLIIGIVLAYQGARIYGRIR